MRERRLAKKRVVGCASPGLKLVTSCAGCEGKGIKCQFVYAISKCDEPLQVPNDQSTLRIDDDAYRRAEGIANARKISLSALVEELVESVTNGAQPNSDDINNLFSALDKGRNTEPIGRLGRQELHDRPVLHRY
jgi:hypothetical protein